MSNTLPIENYVPLTYETKIIRPGRFYIEKLKLSENDPQTAWPEIIANFKTLDQRLIKMLTSDRRTDWQTLWSHKPKSRCNRAKNCSSAHLLQHVFYKYPEIPTFKIIWATCILLILTSYLPFDDDVFILRLTRYPWSCTLLWGPRTIPIKDAIEA